MKNLKNIALIILILAFVAALSIGITFRINMKPVDSSDKTLIEVVIPNDSSVKQIGSILKEKDLIRSSTFFNIYVKLFHVNNMKATTYYLSKDMSFKEIIETLEKGNSYNPNQISIQFKEGYNMREVAKVIDANTDNTYDQVIELSNDIEFINELIDKYWFIDESIKNENVYYKLEGYLFPDTYFFNNKSVTVKEIFIKMLDQMDKVLSKYKNDINKKNLKVRDVLIMASILEKEGKKKDFKQISSVFYNRIEKGMLFQSCATAIYGVKKEFSGLSTRAITSDIMQNNNPYNTYIVKVPVGPIGISGEDAIEAAINPSNDENLYFLSDNQGKTYFFKTYQEHQQKQRELMQKGLWN